MSEPVQGADRYPEAIESFYHHLQRKCNEKEYHGPWEKMTQGDVAAKRKEEDTEVYDALMRDEDEDVREEELDRALVGVIECYKRGVL